MAYEPRADQENRTEKVVAHVDPTDWKRLVQAAKRERVPVGTMAFRILSHALNQPKAARRNGRGR